MRTLFCLVFGFLALNITESAPLSIVPNSNDCIQLENGNQICDDCINIVQVFENNKQKFNNTITHVLEDIKDVCRNISTPRAKECVLVINKIEEFDNIIFNSTSPKTVCRMLHLC